ncbi:hypothetical protein AB1Y20_002324 [Prymnesium parvum]|uniref:Uncharacterized protein n=1 Tax=Prymnesium parvum TaxID=97485 RepID=A0AB34J7P1_PRYPA
MLAWLPQAAMALFFALLFRPLLQNTRMFTRRYARSHRVVGLLLLLLLVVGFVHLFFVPSPRTHGLLFDVVLSLSGLAVALTAARDFGPAHDKVLNEASGTLDQEATVTRSEMLEHSFYQGLNLVQIVYIHAVPLGAPHTRLVLAGVATAPWCVRGLFPINHFSDNYKHPGKGGATRLIRFLYRMKKYQYLLYKHCLLHGLNLSLALEGTALAERPSFRLYWLCLNSAYVLEFFLQTLVKKRYMSQNTMIGMQQILMLVSSYAALCVLNHVRITLSVLSLLLNLRRRGRDASNTGFLMLVALLSEVLSHRSSLVHVITRTTFGMLL